MDASSATSNYDIYTGVWTDWSHNKVFGATLTTTRTYGSLLIAFLSLFVAVVGTSFWRISCFVLHYAYSTESPRDALYHQRQAILRNAANTTTGITSLFLVFNAWRKARPGNQPQPAVQPYRRILPLLAFSCLALAAFAVASTFSSRISTITGNAVLLSGENCGRLKLAGNTSMRETMTVYQPYSSKLLTSNADYAQQCYPVFQNAQGCNIFVRRSLNTKVVRNATCPFPGDICKSKDANLVLDTGLLDSHYDLGLNAPQGHRYQFRSVLQFAPLKTDGFTTQVSSLSPNLSGSYVRYQYGATIHSNYTYEHIVVQKSRFHLENSTSAAPNIDLELRNAPYKNGSLDTLSSDFTPIEDLECPNAELRIAFLSLGTLLFPEQSDDLWYAAHDHSANVLYSDRLSNEPMPMYWSDEPASPMGILQQYQFCKPGFLPVAKQCTPLLSLQDAYDAAGTLWNEMEEDGMLHWLVNVVGTSSVIAYPVQVLGPAVLESNSRMYGGFLGPLAENQWHIDVEKWTNITLASIQQSVVETAGGPSDVTVNRYFIKPESSVEKQICRNQKILSTAYTNFSVFGLATIFIVGGIIIILSYTLEPLVVWIQHRGNIDVYERLEWTMNETLQLQRLAHEELGLGTWHRCDTDIPVTERAERMGVLDLSERTHPRLKAPPVAFDEEVATPGQGKGSREGKRESVAAEGERSEESQGESAAGDEPKERSK